MDWSNERYVRLYTRDTITWKRLRWEGQLVMMSVLRKLDRSGVLDLGGLKSHEALELSLDLPTDILKTGLDRCLETGVLVVDGGRILMPNYFEAQESRAGNAERQRRYRSRRALQRALPSEYDTSTERNEISTERNAGCNALQKSNAVNTKVTPSHAVPSHAVPSHAVPCLAGSGSDARASDEKSPDPETDFQSPSGETRPAVENPNTETICPAINSILVRPRASDPGSPEGSKSSDVSPAGNGSSGILGYPGDFLDFNVSDVARMIRDARKLHKLSPYPERGLQSDYQARTDALEQIVLIAEEEKISPTEVCSQSLRNFYSTRESFVYSAGYPVKLWSSKVGHYFKPPEPIAKDEPLPVARRAESVAKTNDWFAKQKIQESNVIPVSDGIAEVMQKLKRRK
jgi:hypothetical protein